MMSALGRLGADAGLGVEPSRLQSAPLVVLPGVGTFGSAMSRLNDLDLTAPLTERLRAGKPTLCVCVGFQLLFESSEESPGVQGLGILSGRVQRFPHHVRVPQFGWNTIQSQTACELLQDGYYYFANSYYAANAPEAFGSANAEHGVKFVAGVEQGAVLGCQFHPELSSQAGLALLGRWLRRAQEAAC